MISNPWAGSAAHYTQPGRRNAGAFALPLPPASALSPAGHVDALTNSQCALAFDAFRSANAADYATRDAALEGFVSSSPQCAAWVQLQRGTSSSSSSSATQPVTYTIVGAAPSSGSPSSSSAPPSDSSAPTQSASGSSDTLKIIGALALLAFALGGKAARR